MEKPRQDKDFIAKGVAGAVMIASLFWGAYDIAQQNTGLIVDRFYIVAISASALIFYRKARLNLALVLVGLVPVVLHSLGWYDAVWLGLPFDHYLHFSTGLALALIFMNAKMQGSADLGGFWKVSAAGITVVLIVSGIGSLMEVFEFFGARYGGAGSGIFYYGEGDLGSWNANIDLLNNTLGAIFGVIVFLSIAFAASASRAERGSISSRCPRPGQAYRQKDK